MTDSGPMVQAALMSRCNDLEKRIAELELECRHFHRQFELLISHHEHVDGLVQQHEAALFRMQDDHK